MLQEGYKALSALGEVGQRASVAAMLGRTLRARGRGAEADEFVRLVEETASERDVWSQVLHRLGRAGLLADAGELRDAERVGREALAIVETTDLLDLHGDVLMELADVLRRDAREEARRECVARAISLYERKGNRVSADRARSVLAVEVTTS